MNFVCEWTDDLDSCFVFKIYSTFKPRKKDVFCPIIKPKFTNVFFLIDKASEELQGNLTDTHS